MSFVDVIFANLAEHPSRAFVTEVRGDRLDKTYGGRLLALAGQARATLRASGIGNGDRVALLASSSARWVAADLAVLAEGAIAVPLYPRQAPDELVAVMKDAGVRLVICEGDELAGAIGLTWHDAPSITFDQLFDARALADPPRARSAGDVVTLLYPATGGEPEGVMITAGNVGFVLDVIDRRLDELMGRPGGQDRVFHYLPLSFAGSRLVLWGNLYRRNGVMLSTDLADLRRELRTAAPEWFLAVPALLERMKGDVEAKIRAQPRPVRRLYESALEASAAERDGRATLAQRLVLAAARRAIFGRARDEIGADLRCLISGSAPLAAETQAWFELLELPVYQVYGLAEATAVVTMDRPRAASPGTVGFPIAGCEIKLGVGDELLVRGPNVFAGYWKKEQATRDAFADGWLKTGDRARLDAAGRVSLAGRVGPRRAGVESRHAEAIERSYPS